MRITIPPVFSALALAVLIFAADPVVAADQTALVIETAILSPDPFSGMKSRHTIKIDFQNKTLVDEYKTGTTDFYGVSLDSVRDRFKVTSQNFTPDGKVEFKVVGETASGVGVVPSIDYSFVVKADRQSATIKGCHDGYPAYTVTYDTKAIYAFNHKPKDLIKLFGSCDIKLP